MRELTTFLVGFATAIVACGLIVEALWSTREGEWKRQAIDNKAAEWRCDPKTGEKTFVWLTKPESEKP